MATTCVGYTPDALMHNVLPNEVPQKKNLPVTDNAKTSVVLLGTRCLFCIWQRVTSVHNLHRSLSEDHDHPCSLFTVKLGVGRHRVSLRKQARPRVWEFLLSKVPRRMGVKAFRIQNWMDWFFQIRCID